MRKKTTTRYFLVNPKEEKTKPRLNLFNILKTDKSLLVSEVTEKTGMSKDEVSEYIKACAKSGFLKIDTSGKGESLSFNEDHKKVLGIGFTDAECILIGMELSGKVAIKEKIKVGPLSKIKGRNKEFNEILKVINKETRLHGTPFYFAGIAIPDQVIQKSKKAIQILSEGVGRIFHCDVLVAKEATASGYAEKEFGESKAKNILYLHSDIGAGVAIKNNLIYEDDTPEEAASYLRPWKQFSIVDTAKKLVDKGVGTDIVTMVNGKRDAITLEVVLGAAAKDDELAEDLVKRAALALGVRAAYIVNLLDIYSVILGGGIEKKEGNFIKFVRESSGRFLLEDRASKIAITPGTVGKESPSIGTALLCCRELFLEV